MSGNASHRIRTHNTGTDPIKPGDEKRWSRRRAVLAKYSRRTANQEQLKDQEASNV